MLAGDLDLFDDEAEQGLFLVEVEGVDHGQDPGGEVPDAVAELVVAGQFLALGGEGVAALFEVAAALLRDSVGLLVGDFFAFEFVFRIEMWLPGVGFVRPRDAIAVAADDRVTRLRSGPTSGPPGAAGGSADNTSGRRPRA